MIKIIVEIVLGLLAFILYMRIDSLLAARINYINMKAKKCESEALSLIKNDQVSSIAYENTNNILSVIDFLIDKEIAIRLHKLSYDEAPYNVLHVDEDVKAIATDVFESLNKEMIANIAATTVLTEDYVRKYITKETTLLFTQEVTKFNLSRIASKVGVSQEK